MNSSSLPERGDMFAFGKNWQSFLDHALNPGRIEEAVLSLQRFLGVASLEGKTFVDIGCGSGLFSLAAYKLGAAQIFSLDIDPDSVACTAELKRREGNPEKWTVTHGSILDKAFIDSIGQFDVVYSWGVLHHTGKMWQAIENACGLVQPGGVFYIAIYNKTDEWGLHPDGRIGSSSFWLKEKKFYHSLPAFLQRTIDYIAMSGMVIMYVLTLQNPMKKIRGHKHLRGMSWSIDIKDWLGGYPYECATVEEIFRFAHKRGFTLENLKSNNGLLNNEFLFRRSV